MLRPAVLLFLCILVVSPQLSGQILLSPAGMDSVLGEQDWHPDINLDFWVSYDLQKIHPQVAYDPRRLGDINDDGYDDFAFRSRTDTTFIYLGDTLVSAVPYLILPGGGNGLASGDFNGDGYTDLVAVAKDMPFDSAWFGRVYFYLHQRTVPEYSTVADFVLVGDSVYWAWGHSGEPKITSGDYNGDGYDDVAFHTSGPVDPVTRRHGGVVLINGGPDFQAEVSEIFWEQEDPWKNSSDGLWSADITGDGKDELIVQGSSIYSQVLFIYQGTDQEPLGESFDAVVSTGDPIWSRRAMYVVEFCDVNGDGADDAIGYEGDGPFFLERTVTWGWPILPSYFVKDTVFPSPEPEKKFLLSCNGAYGLGDVNGDGYRDYAVAYMVGSNDIWSNYIYSGHPGWHPVPIAWYGLSQFQMQTEGLPYDIGDVNGDGFDDIFNCGYNGFRITLGRPMPLTSVSAIPLPVGSDLLVYPNPAFIGQELRVETAAARDGELFMFDMLGRGVISRRTNGSTTTLPTGGLAPGTYLLLFQDGMQQHTARIVLY